MRLWVDGRFVGGWVGAFVGGRQVCGTEFYSIGTCFCKPIYLLHLQGSLCQKRVQNKQYIRGVGGWVLCGWVDGCFVGGWIGADTVGWVCKLVLLSPPPSEPASASRGASSPRTAVPEVSTQLQTLRTCVAGLDALWLAKVCWWVRCG